MEKEDIEKLINDINHTSKENNEKEIQSTINSISYEKLENKKSTSLELNLQKNVNYFGGLTIKSLFAEYKLILILLLLRLIFPP